MADLTVNTAQGIAHMEGVEILTVRLAETVTKGQVAYQLAAGTFGIADANAAGKQQARGIFLKGGAAGDAVPLLKRGPTSLFDVSALNCDVPIYLSDTAGAAADAAGTMSVILGRVILLTTGVKVAWIDCDWLRAWA